MITGERATINYSVQHAIDGGTNVTVGTPPAGPMTVSGGHGTAIGSQTASGEHSSVVGSQAMQGDHSAIAGRDAGAMQAAKEGWWARLRKRGVFVAFFTVIGGVAGVVGAVAAVLTLLGWTPW